MLRILAIAALAFATFGLADSRVESQEKKAAELAKAKEKLQEVQDFIGLWNLEGTQKENGRTVAWKEKVVWSWKFKDGDAWMAAAFADGKGKYFASATLRYDVAKKKYVLTLTGADKKEAVFEGELGRLGGLQLARTDAKSGDKYKLALNTLAEGVRFQLKYERQEGGKGIYQNVFAMNGNKDGESLGSAKKKPECIVSGGAASIPVSYKGVTYYVCCSGCRDEFLAHPEKYVNAKK